MKTNHLIRTFGILALLILSFAFASPTPGTASSTKMLIVVDATDLPRKLLRSQITFNTSDDAAVLYPKWWPGHHGPVGAVGNIAGLTFTDSNDKTLEWERDWQNIYRFSWVGATGKSRVNANLTYICNQQTANTEGCDSYGYPQIGIINWNTVVLYPEGIPIRDIVVQVKLLLPKDWQYGSALPFDQVNGDTLVFKPVTFEELIDMPLICGLNFSTVKYATTKMADYYLHIAADDEDFLPKDESVYTAFKNLAYEAEALFGRTHFKEYHFLLTVSDLLSLNGLEHRNSSLNGVRGDAFKDPSEYDKYLGYVMPHEFVHAWCGKYRRPVGMDTPDYQMTKNMDMLWVYEGLTTYLGGVLGTRSGFQSFEENLDGWALFWGRHFNQQGRSWRSLRDTQVANYTIRKGSKSWGFLRRNQDYYDEGAMIWLEFDTRIRSATGGRKSLDDFCFQIFSKGDPNAHTVPLELGEVISVLQELADEPWANLIDQKMNHTEDSFRPEGITRSGYAFTFTDKESNLWKYWEEIYWEAQLYHKSVGLTANVDGVIGGVVPDGPADQAGLYDGVKIIGVNGKTYSPDRLERAVRNTPSAGKLTLLTLNGDTYYEYKIDYNGGLRYDKLIPVKGERDLLKKIMKPKASKWLK
ncbi:hypothetical protein HQ531_10745 [bacterium]|nr:hypothetical protein [bacterium]